MSILELLPYSTVRIQAKDRKKQDIIATGTLCYFSNNNVPYYMLVTNKHVIKDTTTGTAFFTKSQLFDVDGNGNYSVLPITGQVEAIKFDDFENKFIPHPSPDIDLAILPLNEFIFNKNIFLNGALSMDLIPTLEAMSYLVAETILTVGYPKNQYDAVNNLPIVRNGITATPPKYDYNGQKAFLIDASVHEGLSGAPVLLYKQQLVPQNNGMQALQELLVFLGIMTQGIESSVVGNFTAVEVPTSIKAQTNTSIPINLGIVIKSSCLLDFKPVLLSHMSVVPAQTYDTMQSSSTAMAYDLSNLPPHIANLFKREQGFSNFYTDEVNTLINALKKYLQSENAEPDYERAEQAISYIRLSDLSNTFRKTLKKYNYDLDRDLVASWIVEGLYENFFTFNILYIQNTNPVKNLVGFVNEKLKQKYSHK